MSKEIVMTNVNGVTLLTKNKYIDDDLYISLGVDSYNGEITDGSTAYYTEDAFIDGSLTTYKNSRVKSIRTNAFREYDTLESVSLPSVVSLSPNAFYGCDSLKDIELPLIKSLPQNALNDCMSLSYLYLPSLENVGVSSLRYCDALSVVDIPNVLYIAQAAFANCPSIKAVIIRQTSKVAVVENTAFNSSGISDGTGFIYVPDELVESYKVATNWSPYASQIKPLSEYVEE